MPVAILVTVFVDVFLRVSVRIGGYAEWIEHGETGFLFETDEEAFAILTRLKADPSLRRRVGEAARVNVETMFSPQNRQRMIDYYLR